MNVRHSTSHTRTKKVAVAGFAAAVAAAMTIGPAAAAPVAPFGPVTGTHDSTTNATPVGFSDAFGPDTDDAVSQFVFVEGTAVQVRTYCVEVGVEFMVDGSTYSASPHSALRDVPAAPALSSASWAARNGTLYDSAGAVLGTIDSPTGDSEADAAIGALGDGAWGTIRFDEVADGIPAAFFNDAEASAMQLAVWSLANGRDITGVVNPAILARANELIDLADGTDDIAGTADDFTLAEAPYSYTLDASFAALTPSTGDVTVTLTGELSSGTVPIVGTQITVTAPGGSGVDLDPATDGVQESRTVTTDAVGQFAFGVETSSLTAVTITASTVDLELEPGVLLTPADNGAVAQQQVIVAEYGSITRTATTEVPAAPAPTTTAPPTTAPAPATTAPAPATTAPAPVTTAPGPVTTAPAPTPTTLPTQPDELPFGGGFISLPVLLLIGAAGAGALVMVSRRNDGLDDLGLDDDQPTE